MFHLMLWSVALMIGFISPANVLLQAESALSGFSGHISYVGIDDNIYVLDGESGIHHPITTDADTARLYYWLPSWSNGGQLAYFGQHLDASGRFEKSALYISDGASGGTMLYETDEQPIYMAWSPTTCGEDCRYLATLYRKDDQLTTRIFNVDNNGGAVVDSIDDSGPVFISWNPDGTKILKQAGQQLAVYDVNTGIQAEIAAFDADQATTPAWSPVDDRLLFAVRNANGLTDLVLMANDVSTVLMADIEGHLAFSWSPNGNFIAYTVNQRLLTVVDVVTGKTVAHNPDDIVLSFFWSPDNMRVAYISLSLVPEVFNPRQVFFVGGLTWSVLDVVSGVSQEFSTFTPDVDMLYLLQYADQFTQSHRIWSPNSHYIVYGERDRNDVAVITILDVLNAESVPLNMAEGSIGIWSYK